MSMESTLQVALKVISVVERVLEFVIGISQSQNS